MNTRYADIGEQLADVVAPILRHARIPGGAIAVVREGSLVAASGFGVRDLVTGLPVTRDTLYPIASTVKAMTATLLGNLVDRKELAWDEPITTWLPDLQFHEEDPVRPVTLRDLLLMRTGLPAHDFAWMDSGFCGADLTDLLPHLPFTADLRERFQYSNISYALAGHLAEARSGASWEELMRARVFEPLGMHSVRFNPPDDGDFTQFYHEDSKRQLHISRHTDSKLIAPAGGTIYASILDMAKWIAFNLETARARTEHLLRAPTLDCIQRAQISTGMDTAAPSPGSQYALGWFVDRYQDADRRCHTGWLNDVNSCVTLYPEAKLGIVSFINLGGPRLASIINDHVHDALLGLTPERSIDEALDLYEMKIAAVRQRNAEATPIAGTRPSQELDAYTGRYRHPGYGCLDITKCAGELSLHRGILTVPLEHWQLEAWVGEPNDRDEIHKPQLFDRANRLTFLLGWDGRPHAIHLQVEPSLPPARFVRDEALGQ